MADSQVLTLILIAAVAGFLLFRLYMVLGRRTGNEPPPEEYRLQRQAENAVAGTPKLTAIAPDRPSDPVASGLFDISLADRSFDKEQFLKGARAAYELVLTAFAKGDRATLKPLLSEEVFAAFDSAIAAREAAGQTATMTLVGFSEVKIIAASCKADSAEITLAFSARLISATAAKDGTVVEGDATAVNDVTDVWSFTRQVRSRDPNWTLVATSSEPR